jgi:DNA-binding MarR family transcriptional regulator
MIPAMTETRTLSTDEWDLWRTWMRAQRLLARELERGLQRESGISQAEFQVLLALREAPDRRLRVGELADVLGWEKSRVSHQLTRMEHRGFVERTECDADGRGTWITITAEGRRTELAALRAHAGDIRRWFLDDLAPAEADAIRTWGSRVIDDIEPRCAVAEADAAGAPAAAAPAAGAPAAAPAPASA